MLFLKRIFILLVCITLSAPPLAVKGAEELTEEMLPEEDPSTQEDVELAEEEATEDLEEEDLVLEELLVEDEEEEEDDISDEEIVDEEVPVEEDAVEEIEQNVDDVRLNEILANPAGSDSGSEFVEIYNPYDYDVHLSNWTLEDASGRSTYTFPDESILGSEAYLTLYNDDDFSFSLNNTGDEITLRDSDGEKISDHTYGSSSEGLSWNRDDPWYEAAPTPDGENEESVPAEDDTDPSENDDDETDADEEDPLPDEDVIPLTYPEILISEILANPAGTETTDEFIELYNPGADDVLLSGWSLRDASRSGSHIISDTTIAANSYYAIYRSDYGFALNNTGVESVSLFDPNDDEKDSLTYDGTEEAVSLARSAEGAFTETTTLTPGAENIITPIETDDGSADEDPDNEEMPPTEEPSEDPTGPFLSLEITELLPNPEGPESEDEYIEIYNPQSVTISLTDWVLRDSSASGSYTFLSGTEITPDSYLTVYREDYGFALNNSGGETVTLISPDDVTQSEVSYSVTAQEGLSYSINNGSFVWSETLTPGADNIITEIVDEAHPPSADNEDDSDEDEDAPHADPNATYLPLIISEILPNPSGVESEDEFIEIYNPHDTDIALFGWTLRDASTTGKYTFGTDAPLAPANDYIAIYRSDYGFALNNSGGETVTLTAPNDDETSIIAFTGAAREDTSYNHIGENYLWSTTLTPGAANTLTNIASDDPDGDADAIPQTANPDATYLHLSLSEFLPNPSGPESTDEYIEIYNPHTEDVSLLGWTLRDGSQTGAYTITDSTYTVPAGGYIVIYRSDYSFALNNSGDESLSLTDPSGTVTAEASYSTASEDTAYIYDLETDAWLTTLTLTPGEENPPHTTTGSQTPGNDPAATYPSLILTEILPNPEGTESEDEFIEIYNPNAEDVPLVGWTLSDNSQSSKYTFEDGVIPAGGYHTIYRSIFRFALNNSSADSVTLTAPNSTVKSTVSYERAEEGASYGWTGDAWRWSRTLTPNATNVFGDALTITDIDLPKKLYREIRADFDVSFTGGGENARVRWDFGDDKKSSLKDTSHIYDDRGTYEGSVRVTNNIESVTQNFTVEVKKYPKHKARIIAIMPNPEGKDVGEEYIIIKNTDNEKIDFDDWSVATGKDDDSLINHPVRKDFSLKKGKSKKVTSTQSAISLSNAAGHIELRRPDGSVADDVSYAHPSKKAAPENAVYVYTDGTWSWTTGGASSTNIGNTETTSADAAAIIAAALANDNPNSTAVDALAAAQAQDGDKGEQQTSIPFWKKFLQTSNAAAQKIITFFTKTPSETLGEGPATSPIPINRGGHSIFWPEGKAYFNATQSSQLQKNKDTFTMSS